MSYLSGLDLPALERQYALACWLADDLRRIATADESVAIHVANADRAIMDCEREFDRRDQVMTAVLDAIEEEVS